MNNLFMIFDDESLALGNEIYKETANIYENIENIIGATGLARHAYGFYYFYPLLFKE